MHYYDPMFYICSEEMPFVVRLEIALKYEIDGSTYKTMFIEISSFNGWFYITLLQGFSCDIYYRALINQLELNGIEYVEEGAVPFDLPDIVLP